MCSIWQVPDARAEELSPAEYDQIFSVNRGYFSRVKHVSITGGEPLLREDIGDIVRLIRRNFAHATLNMNTNGFRTDLLSALATGLADERIPMVYNISLDAIGEVHDRMRGIPRAFQMASNSIKALKELREKTKVVRVNANFTITEENATECERVYRFCRENGLDFNPIMPVFGELYKNEDLDLSLSDRARSNLTSLFEKLTLDNPKRGLAFSIIIDELRRQPRDFRCWASHVMVLIEENADVFPNGGCPADFLLGNLRNNDYSMGNLLRTERARSVQKKIRTCRTCRIPCEALTTLKYPEALYAYRKMRSMRVCAPISDDTD